MLCTICACCEISFSLNFHFICTRICRAFLSEALAFPFSPDFPRKPTIKCHIRGVRETPEPPLFFRGRGNCCKESKCKRFVLLAEIGARF